MGNFLIMLYSLRIKNLAIIDKVEIDFEKGFNVITGETGSGKSIFLNGILLLLVKKVNPSDIIRHGETTCEIEAIFSVNDEELVVRREFHISGRSKAYINDKFVSINKLTATVSKLVEFSAQNENQLLFDQHHQLTLIDAFGGDTVSSILKNYHKVYEKFTSIKKEIIKRTNSLSEINDKINFYKYHLEQINNLNLNDANEEINLIKEIEYAENIELIRENANFCYYEIAGKENSIIKTLNIVKDKISEISDYKSSFADIVGTISNIEIELEEAAKTALNEVSDILDEQSNLPAMYERLNAIKSLKKRLNKTSVSEIISYAKELQDKLFGFENFSIDIATLKEEEKKAEQDLKKIAVELSKKRKEIKIIFEKQVAEHLNELKMSNVSFVVKLEQTKSYTENGIDTVSFLFSTNKGEPRKPLAKIASGGELSRIMLALKTILSEYLHVPILIFDEIDAGTGGETSYAIGKKIKKIADNHQVIVITHLAQVAAFAENHYKIFKEDLNGRVVSNIKKLNENERIIETARMLSGDTVTEKSKENAKELLNLAYEKK